MEKMYVEPQVEAKNNRSGSYVAGCPEHHYMGNWDDCKKCERTK